MRSFHQPFRNSFCAGWSAMRRSSGTKITRRSRLSAFLSFALVTGYGHVAAPAAPAGSVKAFQQRLGETSAAPAAGIAVTVSGRKGDRLEGAPDGCAGQT